MKLTNFLYYILFRAIYQYSVKKEMMPNGTSLLLTLLLSTNTILFFSMILRFSFTKGFFLPYDNCIKIFFGSIFFIWYFILKRYFIEKENYVWIIEKYDAKYKDRIKLIRIIGFLYLILSPISFIVLMVVLSRI